MINLRSNFLQQYFSIFGSLHLKFDIRSMRFEAVILLDQYVKMNTRMSWDLMKGYNLHIKIDITLIY